ncbi:MAG: bacteriohemerythrin [Oscillospiraceae bacterium]|nr:bacteriohemerythrin [Oscillospiraceae bacterium]
MAYEFTKELETGNSIIDGEHKELLKAVNDLLDACGKGQGRTMMESVTKFLLNYVDKHFSHEEQLQKNSDYPGYPAHKKFHDDYKCKLKDIVSKLPDSGVSVAEIGIINSHIGTLITHIRIEDKKLGAYLKNK